MDEEGQKQPPWAQESSGGGGEDQLPFRFVSGYYTLIS